MLLAAPGARLADKPEQAPPFLAYLNFCGLLDRSGWLLGRSWRLLALLGGSWTSLELFGRLLALAAWAQRVLRVGEAHSLKYNTRGHFLEEDLLESMEPSEMEAWPDTSDLDP